MYQVTFDVRSFDLHQKLRRDAELVFYAAFRQGIERVTETALPNQLQGSPGHPVENVDLKQSQS